MMPARIARATFLNFGFSSSFFFMFVTERVNVIDSQFRTSFGTESGSTSDKTSSSLIRRLFSKNKVLNIFLIRKKINKI
jgi:hypothetical protein